MKRCVNIDWLEVYCLEDFRQTPCDAEYFRTRGWSVVERPYGTRVYSQMFTLLDARGEPFLEVRRAPFSLSDINRGFFEPNSCHIRLCNRTCYYNSPVDVLRDFLVKYYYELRKISRIDICMDFERFDTGDDVMKFIYRYLKGTYTKINQANVSAHGTDHWEGRVFNSLSWGKRKSMVSTKLYCKTLELQQVHDKPYIRYAWRDAGLIDDPLKCIRYRADGSFYKPDIWRLEFSIKASGAKYFIMENENGKRLKREPVPHSLNMYDTKDRLLRVFASLVDHYFHFKIYEPDQRKDRCKDKLLFRFRADDICYKLESLASSTSPRSLTDRLERLLLQLRERTLDNSLITSIDRLCNMLTVYRLQHEVDSTVLHHELLALQLLLARRMNEQNKADPMTELHEIRSQLSLFDDVF